MTRSSRRSAAAVTIRSVAERAGVSAMTVSHTLNGTKNVRPETREAVLRAVEELGYVPNTAARSLASAQASRVGIVYRNASNAFLSAMLVGALNAASRAGAQVILRKCDAPTVEQALDAVDKLKKGGANAILLAPPYDDLLAGHAGFAGLNLPAVAMACDRPLPGMDSIGIDEKAAAATATRHLLARGHRRIGFVMGPATHSVSRVRFEGYGAALAEAGLAIDPALVALGDFTFDSGLTAADVLLAAATPPTAILASNDDMAAGVIAQAHRRGLRMPADLAVVGIDDAPIAVKIWPPLTTIRQDVEAMAEAATRRLIERQRGIISGPAEALRMPFELVVRESA
ncbi:substrate-binding domain-containing protein [Novosphingobium sp. FSY-8]|uniref:Substrate-binding domain-containing protein n=1 Tax=Novosphingobium ovatum TaxID=1908523 RepID=A0ABW9XB98_9SPHN|nr:LacI family DNA-binding transcriptional regulator [Novosphingobium ovatum]NBC35816.1 substrate-binding domain-containing protein [Novosphingobium ovatum]